MELQAIHFAAMVSTKTFARVAECRQEYEGTATSGRSCWDASAPCADVDDTPGVDLGDFFAFLGHWDAGC